MLGSTVTIVCSAVPASCVHGSASVCTAPLAPAPLSCPSTPLPASPVRAADVPPSEAQLRSSAGACPIRAMIFFAIVGSMRVLGRMSLATGPLDQSIVDIAIASIQRERTEEHVFA